MPNNAVLASGEDVQVWKGKYFNAQTAVGVLKKRLLVHQWCFGATKGRLCLH